MPIQTTKTSKVKLPDGSKVEYSGDGGSTWVDVGAIADGSNTTATLEHDVNELQFDNAAKFDPQAKNMRITGSFNWSNLDPDVIQAVSGGIMSKSVTAGGAVTTSPDQVISSGDWADKTAYSIIALTSPTDSTKLKASAEPTLTSVTGSVDGALVADDDYTIVADSNSFLGYSIILNLAGTALTTTAQDITIDFASVASVARTTLNGGTSTQVLSSVQLRITHTDSDGNVYGMDIYRVNFDSGSFSWIFKGQNQDGSMEMPLAFTGIIDDTRADGDQLFSYYEDAAV